MLKESDSYDHDYVPTLSDVSDLLEIEHSDQECPNSNLASTAVSEITFESESTPSRNSAGVDETRTVNTTSTFGESTAVDDRFYDLDNAKIYVMKPGFTISQGNKKRKQNQKHACSVCGKLVLHLGEHITRHEGIEEVDIIITNKKLSKSRASSVEQEMFRNKGDHKHNLRVLAKKAGELILSRRPTCDFRTREYGPCPKCYLWMLKVNLPHHTKKCVCIDSSQVPNSGEKPAHSKASLSTESDMLVNRVPTEVPKLMLEEVLGKFQNNAVSVAARYDVLILLLGKHWWTRSKGLELTRRRYVAEKMLRAGKLLICARDIADNEKLTMWDLLRPKYFETLVKSAINITCPQLEGDEENMPAPSSAIKAKYDVARMVQDKIMICAKKADENDDKHIKSKYLDMKRQAEELQK